MRNCCNIIYNIYALGMVCVVGGLLIFLCYLIFGFTLLISSLDWRHRLFYYLTKSMVWFLFWALGIRVCRYYVDEENSFNGPVIFIANHTSYLDSLLILLITNREVYPLGKSEINKIPILGFLYKHYVVSLDREKLSSKKHSFEQMQVLLDKGKSVFIFPEGGFKDEPNTRLEPFTMGAFRLATQFQIPIYPMVFINTRNCFQLYGGKLQIRPGVLKVQCLPALNPPKEMNQKTLRDFRDRAFVKIDEVLQSYAYPL